MSIGKEQALPCPKTFEILRALEARTVRTLDVSGLTPEQTLEINSLSNLAKLSLFYGTASIAEKIISEFVSTSNALLEQESTAK